MPKIVPALLAGVVAGLVMGPLACVVAVRLAAPASDAAAPTSTPSGTDSTVALGPGGSPERNSAETPDPGGTGQPALDRWAEDTWLGRLADVVARFCPPATTETYLLTRPLPPQQSAPSVTAASARGPLDASVIEASGRVREGDAATQAGRDADGAFAVLALRRLERGAVVLLEREVVFEESGIRVLHTERIDGDRRRLVWREFLPGGTRSWMAEWRTGGESARTIAYGWHRPVHESIDIEPGTVGPLELLDALRRAPSEGRTEWTVLEPSAHTASSVIARTVDGEAGAGEVSIEARRADGTLLVGGRSSAPESALDELRFADGGTVATSVTENEFHRRRVRWKVEVVPAHEAMLARIPRRH
ncbi:MAG: hypothetical protein AAGI22_25385 [Planctomycetota bacterium]